MNIANLLTRTARADGERPALALGTQTVASYRELAERAACLAGGLVASFKLAPGDRVAIAMKNDPEFLVVLHAVWVAGLAAVPINAKLHQREFAYILEHSGAKLCFVTPDLLDSLGPLADELASLAAVIDVTSSDYRALAAGSPLPVFDAEPRDPAWLFYTSGTTGRPKGAVLSHRNLLIMTLSYFADMDAISAADCMIHAAPLSHGSGLYSLPHIAKGANNVVPESRGFEPAEIFQLCQAYGGVSMFCAPTMIVRLLNDPRVGETGFSGLKTIVYGGGPMYVEDLRKALDCIGPKFVQDYGQGESPMTITFLSKAAHADTAHPKYLQRLATVGIARTDVEVRVADPDDRTLPPGEIGEILVRGDVVMNGYWNDAEATAKTLRGGWLHTGDVGAMDADGYLKLMDRSKDMIISGGTNIYPREVEEVLLRHAAVREAAVVGRPHPEWGEQIVAFVVVKPGARVEDTELDRVCLENIARFKRPREYIFVDELPKNNYGKVLKRALRESLVSGGAGD